MVIDTSAELALEIIVWTYFRNEYSQMKPNVIDTDYHASVLFALKDRL